MNRMMNIIIPPDGFVLLPEKQICYHDADETAADEIKP